jgi:hypothetical protein
MVIDSGDHKVQCTKIYDNVRENNDQGFGKLRECMEESNVVLVADAVGVHPVDGDDADMESIIRLPHGMHDTKTMWRWLLEHIQKFRDAGIQTIGLEFINKNVEHPFTPLDHTIESIGNLITKNKSSNVDANDLMIIDTLRQLASKINIVGIDGDRLTPGAFVKNAIELSESARPGNRIALVMGSGYASELCDKTKYPQFPETSFEIMNLDREFESDNEIHFIQIQCRDLYKED